MFHTLTQIRMRCQVFCTSLYRENGRVKYFTILLIVFYRGTLILYRVNRLQFNLELSYIGGKF